MVIIFILLFILLIVFLVVQQNNFESFLSYKRCEKKPLKGITKELMDVHEITEAKPSEDWDIYIPCGYTGVEKELRNIDELNEKQKIFGIDGCDKIVSKNNLWKLMIDEYGFEKATTIMPTTYLLHNEKHMEIFKKKFNKDNVYILKRNVQRKKGIKLSNNYYDIINSKYNKYKLVQDMKESYLVNERKFNIRLYLLIVCSKDTTNVYLHKHNKLLYTKDKINRKDKLDFNSNITNSYDVAKDIYDTHPFNVTELEKLTNDNKISKQIKEKITMFSKVIVLPLNKNTKTKNNTNFQLFGVDAIYDKKGEIYYLEANKGPDMIPKDDRDKKMKTKIINDTLSKVEIIGDDNHNDFELVYSL